MSDDDVEHVFKLGDQDEITKALRADGRARLKAELLLRLEETENGVVNAEEKWRSIGTAGQVRSPHNADVEAGKRKGIRMAKKIVADA